MTTDVFRWSLVKYTKLDDARGPRKEMKASFACNLLFIFETSRRSMKVMANTVTLEEFSLIGPMIPSAKTKGPDLFFEAMSSVLSGMLKFRVKFAHSSSRSDVQERLACIDKLRHFISIREVTKSAGDRLSQESMSSLSLCFSQNDSQEVDTPMPPPQLKRKRTVSSKVETLQQAPSNSQLQTGLWDDQTSFTDCQRVPDIDNQNEWVASSSLINDSMDSLWSISTEFDNSLFSGKVAQSKPMASDGDSQTDAVDVKDMGTQTEPTLLSVEELERSIVKTLNDPNFSQFVQLVGRVSSAMHQKACAGYSFSSTQ